jgi:diguanylate cyclase (GGDEF)-like protein
MNMRGFMEDRWRKIVANPFEYLAGRSQPFLMLLGFELVVLVGVIDYLTGTEFGVSIFYLVPISLVAWSTRRRTGILISIMSALTWLLADLAGGHRYSHSLIPYWNMLVRFGFFITVTLILAALKDALAHEKQLARTDSLTGAATGRYFSALAAMHIISARRHNRPFTVAYIDLDNFKIVNDRFGHHTGDALLRSVVKTMQNNVRATDIVARLGGDEFAILLPETGRQAAEIVIQKIQNILLDTMQEHDWPVTFSIGVVTFATPPPTVDAMIRTADGVMYAVKNGGKNMIKHEVSSGSTTII